MLLFEESHLCYLPALRMVGWLVGGCLFVEVKWHGAFSTPCLVKSVTVRRGKAETEKRERYRVGARTRRNKIVRCIVVLLFVVGR